jgi:hypothetical protein
MPCPYSLEIKFPYLSPRGSLRDVVLHRVKCRCRVQEPLRSELRFEFSEQGVALGFARALNSHAARIVRRQSRHRAKLRACQSAQPRQRRPRKLKNHLKFEMSSSLKELCRARLQPCHETPAPQGALAPGPFVSAGVQHNFSRCRGPRILFRLFGQPCLHWILLDVQFRLPELFRVPDPSVMKATMPNRKLLRSLNPHPMCRAAFDHLHSLFNRGLIIRRDKHMQMIGHQHKRVQFEKSSIPASDNLFDDDDCQRRVDE